MKYKVFQFIDAPKHPYHGWEYPFAIVNQGTSKCLAFSRTEEIAQEITDALNQAHQLKRQAARDKFKNENR